MKDKKMNAPSSLQSISLGTLKSEFNLDIWNPEINKAALTEINKEAKTLSIHLQSSRSKARDLLLHLVMTKQSMLLPRD